MKKRSLAIVVVSAGSLPLARQIKKEFPDAVIYSKESQEETVVMESIDAIMGDLFLKADSIVFIGAMGICVRCIAPYIMDKHTDPAVVCIDSTGKYIIPVLSGHIGGANELSIVLAQLLGGNVIVTTQSDNNGLWALDMLADRFDWSVVADDLTDNENAMNGCIAAFVNRKPTALLLDVRDKGTEYLESTLPDHVQLFSKFSDIPLDQFELIITVGPFIYEAEVMMISFFPKVLHIGIGCRKDLKGDPVELHQQIISTLIDNNLCPDSIVDLSSIDLKKDEAMLAVLSYGILNCPFNTYPAEVLNKIPVPNPSARVKEATASVSVSEAAAIHSAGGGLLVLEKQKGSLSEGNEYTFAVAMDKSVRRQGHIEIVGAGPGDPELVSIRGRRILEKADLILYAGSLVPKELTYCAKPGATVRSSADMNLEEQFALMKEFYDNGKFIVRLHTGDPCIYGAIQEQMNFFDRFDMSYHITPGISSFQAAAAALKSQFTIPEKVQTIILTRGEGRTPMPEKEQLHKLAVSQSTMCIYLSAGIADKVQEELLQHYAPTTPVAACYKLTWKDERIYRGELKDLAKIVKDNNLTLTTLLVVGDAIDNREGLSRLYADEFKHLFRK